MRLLLVCIGDRIPVTPRQRTEVSDLLAASKGVNHIIGCHPHVVQPIEVREDSLTNEKHLVVYSLGNYISNMSARRTDGGLMVKMELVKIVPPD